MSKGKYYFSKSLEKRINVLSLFTRDKPVLNQCAIARMPDPNMTSAHRDIDTLEELDWPEKALRTKEICPSLNCLLRCKNLISTTDNLRATRSVADPVHGEYDNSIDVTPVINDTFRRLYHRDARETLTYSLPDASKECLHYTAPGKANLLSISISARRGGDRQSIQGKDHPKGPINFETATAEQLGAMMERNKT